jgi:hypothetical protein
MERIILSGKIKNNCWRRNFEHGSVVSLLELEKCETYRCRRVPFRPFGSKVKVREKTLLASSEQSGEATVLFMRYFHLIKDDLFSLI